MVAGAPAKPTAIKKLEGNPGKRPLNEAEPMPEIPSESVHGTDWMDRKCEYMALDKFSVEEVSKQLWDRFYPELHRLGILTVLDLDLFGRYCETYARWLKAKAFLDKHGETYPTYTTESEATTDDRGKIKYIQKRTVNGFKPFPQVKMYLDFGAELRRHEAELGIGACNRTRIQSVTKIFEKGDEEDEFNYAKKDTPLRAVK